MTSLRRWTTSCSEGFTSRILATIYTYTYICHIYMVAVFIVVGPPRLFH